MGRTCVAIGCRTGYRTEEKEPGVTLHKFPLKEPELLALWLRNICRADFVPTDSSFLCSKHFKPTDFQLQSTDKQKRRRKQRKSEFVVNRRLKPGAYPIVCKDLVAKAAKTPIKSSSLTTNTDRIKKEDANDNAEEVEAMVNKCVALNCTTGYDTNKTETGVTMHGFPLRDPDLLAAWLKNLSRDDFTPSKHSKLCSKHFTPLDFQLFSSDKSVSRRKKRSSADIQRRLKPDAIPTLFEASKQLEPKRGKKSSTGAAIKERPVAPATWHEDQVLTLNDVEKKLQKATISDGFDIIRYPTTLLVCQFHFDDSKIVVLDSCLTIQEDLTFSITLRGKLVSPKCYADIAEHKFLAFYQIKQIMSLIKNWTSDSPSIAWLEMAIDCLKHFIKSSQDKDGVCKNIHAIIGQLKLAAKGENQPRKDQKLEGVVMKQEAGRLILLPVWGQSQTDSTVINPDITQAPRVVGTDDTLVQKIRRMKDKDAQGRANQKTLDDLNAQFAEGVRLFGLKLFNTVSDAANAIQFHSNDPNKVCTAVPEFCPKGVRTATFLVDLSGIEDSQTLYQDSHGTWGASYSTRKYYRIASDKNSISVAKDGESDFCVRRNKYTHRDTGDQFHKLVYRLTDKDGVDRWGLICYEWSCEPFEFTSSNEPTPSKASLGVGKGNIAPSRGSILFTPEDPKLLSTLDTQLPEGVNVFSTRPVQLMADAAIITQFQCDSADRICTANPTLCPMGLRSCTFVLDLSHFPDLRQLTVDSYGKWGHPLENKSFFQVNADDRSVRRVNPAAEEWDILLKSRKEGHPDANRQFTRAIYWQHDRQGHGQFAIVSYHWHCQPYKFTPGSSSANTSQRTALPSTSDTQSLKASADSSRKRPAPKEDLLASPSPLIGEQKWTEMVRQARELPTKGQIAEFPDQQDLYIVIVDREQYTVQRRPGDSFECTCADFKTSKHICVHSLACAQQEDLTSAFMQSVRKNANKTGDNRLEATPDSELMPPAKKLAKSGPSISIPSPEEIESLQHEKQPIYTQPYHNDGAFLIGFLQDFSHQERCSHCQGGLVEQSSAPEDLVIAHEETFMDSGTGKYGRECAVQLVHARYSCLLERYPYFHMGLIEMAHETRDGLNPIHRNHLKQQFGLDVDFMHSY